MGLQICTKISLRSVPLPLVIAEPNASCIDDQICLCLERECHQCKQSHDVSHSADFPLFAGRERGQMTHQMEGVHIGRGPLEC